MKFHFSNVNLVKNRILQLWRPETCRKIDAIKYASLTHNMSSQFRFCFKAPQIFYYDKTCGKASFLHKHVHLTCRLYLIQFLKKKLLWGHCSHQCKQEKVWRWICAHAQKLHYLHRGDRNKNQARPEKIRMGRKST